MSTVVVTTRLDAETLAGLDKLATYHERSRAWLIAKAVKQFVKDESEFFAFLQEGEDDFERGDYVTHEDFVAELKSGAPISEQLLETGPVGPHGLSRPYAINSLLQRHAGRVR